MELKCIICKHALLFKQRPTKRSQFPWSDWNVGIISTSGNSVYRIVHELFLITKI